MKKIIPLITFFIFFLTARSQNFIWTQHGGSISHETATALCTTSNGDILMACTHPNPSTDSVDFSNGSGTYMVPGNSAWYLVKYDSNGQIIWAKGAWGSAPVKLVSCPVSGNIYAGFWGANSFAAVQKFTASGNSIWIKFWGNSGSALLSDMAADSNDNIYCAGTFSQQVDFDPGSGIHNITPVYLDDLFISKLDSSGNFKWVIKKDFGFHLDVSATIEIFNDNIIYYAGVALSPADDYLMKIDSSGNEMWTKLIYNNGPAQPLAFTIDNNANAYFAYSISNSYSGFAKADSSGNVLWRKFLPIAPSTNWIEMKKICVTGQNIFIASDFYGQIDFDPSTAYDTVWARNKDIFIAEYDTSGNYIGRGISGSGAIEELADMIIDASGDLYLCGGFRDSFDIDLSYGYSNIYLVGGPASVADFFFTKLPTTLYTAVSNPGIVENNSISVFPNPIQNILTVTTQLKKAHAEIYNIMGEKILERNLSSPKTEINLSNEPNGIYFIQLKSSAGILTKKIILSK